MAAPIIAPVSSLSDTERTLSQQKGKELTTEDTEITEKDKHVRGEGKWREAASSRLWRSATLSVEDGLDCRAVNCFAQTDQAFLPRKLRCRCHAAPHNSDQKCSEPHRCYGENCWKRKRCVVHPCDEENDNANDFETPKRETPSPTANLR